MHTGGSSVASAAGTFVRATIPSSGCAFVSGIESFGLAVSIVIDAGGAEVELVWPDTEAGTSVRTALRVALTDASSVASVSGFSASAMQLSPVLLINELPTLVAMLYMEVFSGIGCNVVPNEP